MTDDDATTQTDASGEVIDLALRARHAMLDEGFEPDLPPDAERQLGSLPPEDFAGLRDLRHLLWSSIDNPDSRDLDQVEWAERLPDGAIRVLVGVADVDSQVAAWSPLDAHAARSTTSVYTGVATFPMLPDPLSTDRTSLNPGENRAAIVVAMTVHEDGAVRDGDVFRAVLHNHAKLVYEEVGPWLEGKANAPAAVAASPEMAEQLRLQDEAARRLAARRRGKGALELETAEPRVVLSPDRRRVVELEVPPRNRAHRLIESLMIAANVTVARFLEERGLTGLQRVVRPPERWGRIVQLAEALGDRLPETARAADLAGFLERRRAADPLRFPDLSLAVVKLLGPGEYMVAPPGGHVGHFGLATPAYTHSTAPNRRYPDLITQRIVKAMLAGAPPPYDAADLDLLARHCTEREAASRKVERTMRKVAAAALLSGRIGEEFEAVVTGVARKGTFVRVLAPPVEGRVVAGEAGLDIGDLVRVRLVATDPSRGYIDFARVVVLAMR
jgi:exoribonuclease-2